MELPTLLVIHSMNTYGQILSYSALTGEVAEIFYGISPDDDNDD